jgi:hypothetical protein
MFADSFSDNIKLLIKFSSPSWTMTNSFQVFPSILSMFKSVMKSLLFRFLIRSKIIVMNEMRFFTSIIFWDFVWNYSALFSKLLKKQSMRIEYFWAISLLSFSVMVSVLMTLILTSEDIFLIFKKGVLQNQQLFSNAWLKFFSFWYHWIIFFGDNWCEI